MFTSEHGKLQTRFTLDQKITYLLIFFNIEKNNILKDPNREKRIHIRINTINILLYAYLTENGFLVNNYEKRNIPIPPGTEQLISTTD